MKNISLITSISIVGLFSLAIALPGYGDNGITELKIAMPKVEIPEVSKTRAD